MEYPWYELVENCDNVTQGDILFNCPVPVLKSLECYQENQTVDAAIEYINGIILTQACDIANAKVENIILCSITSKSEFEQQLEENGETPKAIKRRLESIIKGQQNAYHIVNRYKTKEFEQDYYIVNFKDIFSVPLKLARDIALQSEKRLRLCPPYREHLSQAFARYFMRVGLPININLDDK